MVQWLGWCHTSATVGTGSIPGWGTKIPHEIQWEKIKKDLGKPQIRALTYISKTQVWCFHNENFSISPSYLHFALYWPFFPLPPHSSPIFLSPSLDCQLVDLLSDGASQLCDPGSFFLNLCPTLWASPPCTLCRRVREWLKEQVRTKYLQATFNRCRHLEGMGTKVGMETGMSSVLQDLSFTYQIRYK